MDKDVRDKLVDGIFSTLNTKFKDTNQKSFRLSDPDSPENAKEFCSTGCTPLDVAISNRVGGGIPYGKITELNGLNSSGKSLLLATILVENQKKGGISIFLDNEFAVDGTFYEAIGMNLDQLVYSQIEYIEDMLDAITEITLKIRKENPTIPIAIGLDSIAGAKTRSDAEGMEKGGYNTHKAIILSQKLPIIVALCAKHNIALIATQQLRQKVGGMGFGDPYVSASGGMALAFFASVRIRLATIGKIKAGDLVVGVKSRARVEKTRLGPPFREAEFEIFFDSGIDDAKSCLEQLKFYKVVEGTTWKIFKEDLHLPGFDLEWRDKETHSKEAVLLMSPKGKAITTKPDVGFYPKFQLPTWRNMMRDENFRRVVAEQITDLSVRKYAGYMEKDDMTTLVTTEDENAEVVEEAKATKKEKLKAILAKQGSNSENGE
jgi:recombination protein RecA